MKQRFHGLRQQLRWWRHGLPLLRPADRFDFDDLARDLARGLSRREALARLGGALVGAVIGSLHLDPGWAQGSTCAAFCAAIYPPGALRQRCQQDAAAGTGRCFECGPGADQLRRPHGPICGTPDNRFCCLPAETCVLGSCRCGSGPGCATGSVCVPVAVGAGGVQLACRPGSPAGDVPCDFFQTRCPGGCVDLATDPRNCGGCGRDCSANPPRVACVAGNCSCPLGTTECDGACVDTSSDPNNCSRCDNRCAGDQRCINGGCIGGSATPSGQTPCPPGQISCGKICVDPQTHANNCGACGNACQDGKQCRGGQCVCPTGLTDCGGTCVDTRADPSNCGGCGKSCPGVQTQPSAQDIVIRPRLCVNGTCRCPSGLILCGDACLDPTTDAKNCGGCGKACSSGQTCCSGICTDTQKDVRNCGRCGNICTSSQAQPGAQDIAIVTCVNGACRSCPSGQIPCGNSCIDPTTDAKNCGGCGKACPSGQACCSGTCADTQTDANNCGRCGNVCPSGQGQTSAQDIVIRGACVSGTCRCPSGQILCAGTCVDPNTDANNCGGCGNTCPTIQGQPTAQDIVIRTRCVNGTCSSCPAGLVLCGGACVDTNSDVRNCGRCGNICTSSQAQSGAQDIAIVTCVNGTCRSCPADQIPCGSACVNASTDPNNCGACGRTCPSGQSCCSGACVDTQRDVRNCGRCGNVCTSSQAQPGAQDIVTVACVNGTCRNCPSGQILCGNSCVDPNSDSNNCGGCGNVCPSGTRCVNGKCVGCGPNVPCPSGLTCCSNLCIDTRSDPNNCGSCGGKCNAPPGVLDRICQGSQCVCPAGTQPFALGNCNRCCPVPQPGQNITLCCDANGGTCRDVSSDPNNCGFCGGKCTPDRVCQNSQCVCPAGQQPTGQGACSKCCPIPQGSQNIALCCDAGGGGATTCTCVCMDVSSDSNNCGFCGGKCAIEGTFCQNSQCVCPTGMSIGAQGACRKCCPNGQNLCCDKDGLRDTKCQCSCTSGTCG